MTQIDTPFPYEVARHLLVDGEAEEVGHLRGEDRDGDAGGETHYDGIRDKLDDRSKPEKPHHKEDTPGHECGDGEAGKSVLLHYVVDNDDKGTCRTAYLHGIAAEGRHHEASDDGCEQTYRRADSARDGERDGERKGDNPHHDTRHEVLTEFSDVIVSQGRHQGGPEFQFSLHSTVFLGFIIN